jgi:hypothetical protein
MTAMRMKFFWLTTLFLAIGWTCFATNSRTNSDSSNLFQNGDFRLHTDGKADGFVIEGSAELAYPGNPHTEVADWGVALKSTGSSGAVWQMIRDVQITRSKWYRFTFRGLPQTNFAVKDDDLYMKVEFLGSDGTTGYDAKRKAIYDQVEQARKDLDVNGIGRSNGADTWHTYQLDFCLPFPQVHALKMSVGFGDGAATESAKSAFYATDFKLVAIPDPPDPTPANEKRSTAIVPVYDKLIAIGGRWYYAAAESESQAPRQFDQSNANRLLYKDAGYSAPFGGNTSAWLHKGNVDLSGNTVQSDRLVADNLVISFDKTSMILRTHGLPNHPTGAFPSRGSYDEFRGNPNSIVERISTYYIPLNPTENPKHVATTTDNSNHALPMGPIGIAINGVVFFNPFDAQSTDATDLMDRCCGHPAPNGQYHYHKYPICVNSPWADEGKEHSPLIGFAFDGFPVYGPYESRDVMAKDVTGEHALNEFNITYDDDRGWHYHVTPGKFPYIIGGFWGTEDARDGMHGGRRGMGGGMGGPGGGRLGGGPPGGPGSGPPPGGGFGPPPGGN